jgi:hypothetical protein
MGFSAQLCVFLVAVLGLAALGSAKRDGRGKAAVEEWVNSLVPDVDYNSTGWRYRFHSKSPQTFFDQYVRQVSAAFAKHEATVNFCMVGACDGLADPAIRDRFLPSKHWRAVFVEPMSVNVRDLVQYLKKGEAFDRSTVLRAAATKECENPTLMVERPLYEEKNLKKDEGERKNIPHWLRREIGSVLKPGQTKARAEWTLEEVRCVTASTILEDWVVLPKLDIHYKNWTSYSPDEVRLRGGEKPAKIRRRRPHVLKIDVEGHDYEVLMSFVNERTYSVLRSSFFLICPFVSLIHLLLSACILSHHMTRVLPSSPPPLILSSIDTILTLLITFQVRPPENCPFS